MFTYLTHLDCSSCSLRYDADERHNLCQCGAPLLARYDTDRLRDELSRDEVASRAPSLWRYHELLPVRTAAAVVTLGEGMTPLLPAPELGRRLGVERLLVKDEGLLPTGTFKARGAAVGVSRAAELGAKKIAMPTNGNAGAAWATYAARAGMGALIVMPVDAPAVTRAECIAAGASLSLVRGLISDAGSLVRQAVETGDWFDASTLKEPYRLEGKKTMGFEIAEQLGWRLPDVIVYPTGGGVGLIGIYKAIGELRDLGWVSGPDPRLVAVQSSGCAPVVEAFRGGARTTTAWPDGRTVAFGINVPKPLGDRLILDALASANGIAVAVDDEDILEMVAAWAGLEGLFPCPEGAACAVAVGRLRDEGWIRRDEEVVILNTGAGLKYPQTIRCNPPVIEPGGSLFPVGRGA